MVKIAGPLRPLLWVGSSKRDYGKFPTRVQDRFGFELFLAQTGQHPPSAKPLKGFGRGTIELVGEFEGDAYRAVYTVRFMEAVYVLHAFQKKSKRGSETPRREIETIAERLKGAEMDYAERFRREKKL
jgi:phage-related protein